MSHGKMSDFVSFSLFGFTLFIKLRGCKCEILNVTEILFLDKKK